MRTRKFPSDTASSLVTDPKAPENGRNSMRKMKVVLAGLALAGLAVSSAIAAPPEGKGKPETTGTGCKPKIAVVLKGTLASTPGATATALSVKVTSGNHWGSAYVKATQPTSVKVDTNTKVRRQGGKTLGDLLKDDRVLVQARVCEADLANNATPALTASKVIAHPARAANDAKDDKTKKDKDDENDDD
jgi:hypothetical protein